MQSRCKLESYHIPKFSYEIDPVTNQSYELNAEYNTEISLGVSHKDETKGRLTLEVRMSTEQKEINYNIKIIGNFEFTELVTTNEEKEKALKEEAFVIIYNILQNTVEGIPEITYQTLPPLPELDEMNPFRE